jgi:hypothetical protein
VDNSSVTQSTVEDNTRKGIFLEISEGPFNISGNDVIDNGRDQEAGDIHNGGIVVISTEAATINNNTIRDNTWTDSLGENNPIVRHHGVKLFEDNDAQKEADAGCRESSLGGSGFTLKNVNITNNTFLGTDDIVHPQAHLACKSSSTANVYCAGNTFN